MPLVYATPMLYSIYAHTMKENYFNFYVSVANTPNNLVNGTEMSVKMGRQSRQLQQRDKWVSFQFVQKHVWDHDLDLSLGS